VLIHGIVFGLLAAAAQSSVYVFSRMFVTTPGNSPRMLFALSHAWMGLFAAALLPFCMSADVLNVRGYGLPLAGACAFYLIGQLCLFQAIQWTDASRVSPLLGLKILMLACIAAFVLGQDVTSLQWVAVIVSLTAASALNYSGGSIPTRGIVLILGACLLYALSDLSIVRLTRVLAPHHEFGGILMACCLCYLVCGLVGGVLVVAGPREHRSRDRWRRALPVGLAWFVAMVFLYVCFNAVGALFGNILQAMRGPFSVLIGAVIARVGWVHLEQRLTRGVLLRRLLAALLMVVAIGLYVHGSRRPHGAEDGPARLLDVPQEERVFPDRHVRVALDVLAEERQRQGALRDGLLDDP